MSLSEIPLPTDWITAKPINQGAVPADNFSYTITGLTASTIYLYRAYMVVDGIPYYGDTLQICTGAIPIYVPNVCTGNAFDISCTSMNICQNKVINNGGAPINEYGVLYTQNSKFSSAACMTYGSTNMCMKSICSDIIINTDYFTGNTCTLSGLNSNTNTYFRAFAKNSAGLGYGSIKAEQTEQLDVTPIEFCLNRTSVGCGVSGGFICANPALSVGQCAVVNVEVCHHLVGSGSAMTRILCRPNNTPAFIQIYCCSNTYNQQLPLQSINVSMQSGDAISWNHCTNGSQGSYSYIEAADIASYSTNISPTISPIHYCDRISCSGICNPL